MATPSDQHKDKRRIRLEHKRKERSMRWAKALSNHCRCDYCTVPYARQAKHRHDYTKEAQA